MSWNSMIEQDVKYGVKISGDEGDIFLYFKTKRELKQNKYCQNQLKKYNSADDSNFQKITCLCKPQQEVYLSSKTRRDIDYYFLSNFQGTSHHHSSDCIFYTKLETLNDDEGFYTSKIFEEPKYIHNPCDSEKKERDAKESQRKYTYYNFCRDLIQSSYSYAFNLENKNAKDRSELRNPNVDKFYQCFFSKFEEQSIKSTHNLMRNKSIKESMPKDHSLVFGTINENVFDHLYNNKDKYWINVSKLEKMFKENEDKEKEFVGYSLVDKKYCIEHKRLELTKRLVQNFDNLISPPYFFIGVLQKFSYKKKYYYKLVRFFVHPIYFQHNKISFVESDYERQYAKKLFTDNVPFIKPISDLDFASVNGKFVDYNTDEVNEDNENILKRAHLKYRPDFIEFKSNRIFITEVSGYDDEKYIQLLIRKVKHYRLQESKSNELYLPRIVDYQKREIFSGKKFLEIYQD